jgi:hypothetical protein
LFEAILPVSNPSLEFHMGIRISSKTWRAPLQFIDSWLPSPASYRPSHRQPLGRLIQRFARAGWLGHRPTTCEQAPNRTPAAPPQRATRPAIAKPVRIVRPAPDTRGRARLVISGRISDVCAELDRLASLEQRASAT